MSPLDRPDRPDRPEGPPRDSLPGASEPFAGVRELVLRGLDGEVPQAVDAASRARFVTRARAEHAEAALRRESRRARWAFSLAAAFTLGALVVFVARRVERTLPVEVAGAALEAGAYVHARGEAPVALRFGDGSEVTLRPGGALRLGVVGPRGADLMLEAGSLDARIAKQGPSLGGASWSVRAGPYVVRVRGTSFVATWSPAAQELRVELFEGRVEVDGPGGAHRLEPGQRLVASASEMRIEPLGAQASLGRREALAPRALAATGSATVDEPSEALRHDGQGPLATASPSEPPSWSKRVASGDFAGVLREADERGVDGVLSSASSADLMALADAARYGGRGALATRALQAVRARFGGSRHAATATFLLGRLADEAGRSAEAGALFDAYLAGAGGGAFAAEALGRRLVLARRGGGDARALAERYVAAYPNGPYATVAREILGER